MKATVTLDPDVQAAVDKLRAPRGISRRKAVNELLRLHVGAANHEAGGDALDLPSYPIGLLVDVACAAALDDAEFEAHH